MSADVHENDSRKARETAEGILDERVTFLEGRWQDQSDRLRELEKSALILQLTLKQLLDILEPP